MNRHDTDKREIIKIFLQILRRCWRMRVFRSETKKRRQKTAAPCGSIKSKKVITLAVMKNFSYGLRRPDPVYSLLPVVPDLFPNCALVVLPCVAVL